MKLSHLASTCEKYKSRLDNDAVFVTPNGNQYVLSGVRAGDTVKLILRPIKADRESEPVEPARPSTRLDKDPTLVPALQQTGLGIIGMTAMIDRLINESDQVTGDIDKPERMRFRVEYHNVTDADRARIKGYLDRRMRESLDALSLRRARAVNALMRTLVHGD